MACEFSSESQTWEWNPPLEACEPIYCNQPPPNAPDNVLREEVISANQSNHQKFETNISYVCPSDESIADLLKPGFSFDFNNARGNVQNITLTCESDGTWLVHGGYTGDSCSGAIQGEPEKCDVPIIPACVDRNKYCSIPPPVPGGASIKFVNKPLPTHDNISNTIITYECDHPGFAFGYSTDPMAPSHYFVNNIHSLNITCNFDGY